MKLSKELILMREMMKARTIAAAMYKPPISLSQSSTVNVFHLTMYLSKSISIEIEM